MDKTRCVEKMFTYLKTNIRYHMRVTASLLAAKFESLDLILKIMGGNMKKISYKDVEQDFQSVWEFLSLNANIKKK